MAHLTEDERHASRHVLAAVRSHALDDHGGAGIPDCEALARQSVDKPAPARRPHKGDVAHDDVLVELEGRALRRGNGEDAAGEPLAKIVVRIAADGERHAGGG